MKIIYENEYGKSIEFGADSTYKITSIQGLSDNVVDVYEASSVKQIGSSRTGTKVQSKNITLTGDFYYTLQRRMDMINTIVPNKMGIFRYIDGDLDVYLEVTPSKSPLMDDGRVVQSFQFELRASYPYWKESKETTYDFTQIVSFFRFPRSFSSANPWKISRFTNNVILNIRNESSQETGFTLIFKAITDVTKPELLNIETQQHITVKDNFVLKAGEQLVITTYDDKKRCVLIKNGLEFPGFRYLSDDTTLFNLLPGDNIIRYGAADNYRGLRARVTFNKTLAGI